MKLKEILSPITKIFTQEEFHEEIPEGTLRSCSAIDFDYYKSVILSNDEGRRKYEELREQKERKHDQEKKELQEKIDKTEDEKQRLTLLKEQLNKLKKYSKELKQDMSKSYAEIEANLSEFLNFSLLEELFPLAKHAILKKTIEKEPFLQKINAEFRKIFEERHSENSDDWDLNSTLWMYCDFLNNKIFTIYQDSHNKKYETEQRKENEQKTQRTNKRMRELKRIQSQKIDLVLTPKIEQKFDLPQEYIEQVQNFLLPFVSSEKLKSKMEKEILRLFKSAYVNNKPIPLDTIIDWLKEHHNVDISNRSKIDELKLESLKYGYSPSISDIETTKNQTKTDISQCLSEEKNTDQEILPSEQMKDNTSEQENSTSLDAENLTAEKVIEIFKNQGFNFSSVEKFQEQFETLLGNTSYGIKKKRRLCRILQKDLNRAWYTYNDKYRVMKIKAGGQALRIVRNEKTICDFLNYGDYKKKYANQTFGRRHKNI